MADKVYVCTYCGCEYAKKSDCMECQRIHGMCEVCVIWNGRSWRTSVRNFNGLHDKPKDLPRGTAFRAKADNQIASDDTDCSLTWYTHVKDDEIEIGKAVERLRRMAVDYVERMTSAMHAFSINAELAGTNDGIQWEIEVEQDEEEDADNGQEDE